ncbi:MAG: peptidylprolyl isomerase [Pseudomonadota bacterium]
MRYLKDPLILFLLFGLILFFLERLIDGGDTGDYQIDVTLGQQSRIFDQWQAQMGRPPTAEEADGLIEQWIREEILYREAKRLELDSNDTIIRRRLAQKLTFLNEDLANAVPPEAAELEGYFENNVDRYLIPEQYSFEHRYFSSDRRDNAEADARAAITDPVGDGAPQGDPFILQRSYADRSARELGDLFGRAFAESLAALPAGEDQWQGPVQSAYGWHLVRLSSRSEARKPPLAEVRDAVQRDYLQERRRRANDDFYQALRSRYDIQLERLPAAAENGSAPGA